MMPPMGLVTERVQRQIIDYFQRRHSTIHQNAPHAGRSQEMFEWDLDYGKNGFRNFLHQLFDFCDYIYRIHFL